VPIKMSDNTPWIVGLIVAVVLVGAIVVLRRHVQTPPPESQVVAPARPTHHFGPRRPASAAFDSDLPSSGDTFEQARGAAVATKRKGAPAPVEGAPVIEAPRAGEQPADVKAMRDRIIAAKGVAPDEPLAEATALGITGTGPALSVSFDGSALTANQTAPIVAQGLEFDPQLSAARFPTGAALAYPDSGGINLEEGTITFWVRTEWDPRDPSVAIDGKTLAELATGTWENRLGIHMGPRFVSFLITTSDGVEHGTGSPIAWAQGEWHNITTTWGQALMSLYIDADLKNQNTYDGTLQIPPETPLYVASTKTPRTDQGTVWMRNWQVFQRALAADEIAAVVEQTTPSQ
jgi:hypothetical protein